MTEIRVSTAKQYSTAVRIQSHNDHIEQGKASPFAGIKVHAELQTPDYSHYQVLERVHQKNTDAGNQALAVLKKLLPEAASKDMTHKTFDEATIASHRPTDETQSKAFDKAKEDYLQARKAHVGSESSLNSMKEYLEATCAFPPENPLEAHAKGLGGWFKATWNKDIWGKAKAILAGLGLSGLGAGAVALVVNILKPIFGGNNPQQPSSDGQTVSIEQAKQLAMMAYQKGLQAQQGKAAGGLTTVDATATPVT